MENVITLSYPIEFGTRTVDELEFREVTAAEMRSVKPNMSIGDLLDIAQKLCDQNKSVMNKLRAEDVNKVLEYVGNALAGGV